MYEERIPIKILGQSYEILGHTSDALYFNSLAQYVETKMKEVQLATNIVSSQKIAVLAALNIADELFRERDTKSNSGQLAMKKHEELIQFLDQVLESPKTNVVKKNGDDPQQMEFNP